jgi:N-acetylmuramoyl-L-alanine amidase CwlA
MPYTVTQKFISKNRSGKTLIPVGIVLHETATPNATAEAEYRYFNNGAGGRSASAHVFIDYSNIIQTVPYDEQSWHAGNSANRRFIGIELCNFADKTKFEEIYKKAVWLFADLFINVIKVTTITKENLMSHAEVSEKWGETNHNDPVAYFAKFGKTVDMFRKEVQDMINEMVKPKKYYIITNYIPQGEYGVEINSILKKYFDGLERVYIKQNQTGIWIESQYISKELAQIIADKLSDDELLWKLVEE